MDAIKDLYIRYISPETPSHPTDKEYYQKLCNVQILEEQLTNLPDHNEIELFEEIMYNKLDCENDKINNAFVAGYKLGCQLILDMLK